MSFGWSLLSALMCTVTKYVWPQAPLRVHPLEFAGKSVKEKLQDIRKELKGSLSP